MGQSFTKEVSFVADNDLFVSYVKDQYYSSGLFAKYRWMPEQTADLKIIKTLSLHHKIFTPYKSIVSSIQDHDRPFAALLCLTKSRLKASEKGLRQSTFQLGIMGPAALGREIQTALHDIYGFPKPIGWTYQIENSPVLGYAYSRTHKLINKDKKFSDSYVGYGVQVGTIYNHITGQIGGRIGFRELAPMHQSMAFGTHLDGSNRRIESFLQWQIQAFVIGYDATMQGGLFDNNSPVTFAPNILRLNASLGYFFTAKNWNFGYRVVFSTNERSNLTNDQGHFYGSISISKLFN